MNNKSTLLWIVIVVASLLAFSAIQKRRKNAIANSKKEQLKSLYKREPIYLCNAIDNLGKNRLGEDLIQFYGEPFGTSVRPGMKISVSGVEYTIHEVYANDKTPGESDAEIPNGMPNTAILVESGNFHWGNLKQNLKQEGVIAFKLISQHSQSRD